MWMEAEILSMLIWGFIIIFTISLGIIAALWFKKKNNALLWFILQLVFLALCFFKFSNLIQQKPQIPEGMQSENNSLALGITGVLWAASMIFMLIGIWNLSKKKKMGSSRL